MPFTLTNGLLNGKFGKSKTAPAQKAASSSSLFDAGQTGSVSDNDTTFQSHDRADSAPVVNDPGDTSAVPTFSAPVEPLGGSPGSFTVMDMGDDAPVGEVNTAATPEASGTSVHEQNGPDDAVPTFEIAPGQAFPGNIEGTQSTKAVDPAVNDDVMSALAAAVVAEASEDDVDWNRVDALSDAAQALSAPDKDDGGLPMSALLS